jgi:NAD(P) transhydrogenase subunit alpha
MKNVAFHRSPLSRRAAQLALAALAGGCLLLAIAPAQERQPPDSPSSAASNRTERATRPAPAPARPTPAASPDREAAPAGAHSAPLDYWSMLFVFALSTLIGLGVIGRVSRLLHTPLMSLTNAISAIAVVGAIIVVGSDGPNYPLVIRILGAIALFASMTNIVSGFLITDRMLKMFKTPPKKAAA